jgi:pyruvate/2-oxoglutarate/acetoin dehydrogenase E1 component
MPHNSGRHITLRAAVLEALSEEMELDPRIILMGEDVGKAGGVFKQTDGLFERFGPERVIDTPISESAIFGLAVGAAMTGMRPVVEVMFADFITLVLDQLVNQAAKVHYMSAGGFSVPLVLRSAVGVGGNLGPQHSQSPHAWLAHMPGLKVVMPSSAADAKGLFKSAIRDNNPVIFLEDRMTYNMVEDVPTDNHVVPLGLAEIKRAGRDITIIAISRMVHVALEAAEKLAAKGIEAEIVDPRTLVPLDIETLAASVRKTSMALVVDGGYQSFGVTGEIVAALNEAVFDYLDAPILRVAAPDVPIPYAKSLEPLAKINPDQIVKKVLDMFGDSL